MKSLFRYFLLIVTLLATIQLSNGQTFDLGLAFEDSTMVKFVDSIRTVQKARGGENFFDAVEIAPTWSSSSNMPNNSSNKTNPGGTGPEGPGGPMLLYYTNLHPHIPNTFAINTSKTVGEIPIQHQVTANGSTTYSVPIECAPGRAGVQPSITLVYNSLAGNGVLGFGWGIGGLSAINRTTSNFYFDGSIKPTEMTASAKFVLDGTQLLQTGATTTSRSFVPEQGNVRIEAYMNGTVTKYFKVWFSNGSTAIYGYDTNSVNKLSYPITLMTDVKGNTIKFTYEEANNHYYIKEIKYGSSKTIVNDFALIKFFYKTRTDLSGGWDAGIEITENRLLDYIQCINNSSSVIRTYNFTYTLNKVSLLTQIDCNLSSGSLNPLKFYYGTNNPQTAFTNNTAQLTSWFSNTTVPSLTVSKGKFDIWNDDDALISYPRLNPYYEQGSVYQNLYATNQTLLVYSGLADSWVYPDQFTSGTGFMELTSGDIDGKGGDELIKINNYVSGTYDYLTFTVYKPAFLGYSTYKTVNYTPLTAIGGSTKSITPKVFVLGDFAGIGRLQVLAVSRYNPLGNGNATKIMVFDLETGTTLCNTTFSGFNFTANNTSSNIVFAMDYDGDGRNEICHIHSNGTDIYAFSGTTSLSLSKIATISDLKQNNATSCKLMVGDINGDGKTDLLLSPYESYNYSYWTSVPVSNHRYCPYCHIENPGSYSCRNCYQYLSPSNYCYDCGATLSNYCNGYYSYDLCCPYHGTYVNIYINEYIDNGNQWTAYYSKGANGFDKKTIPLFNHMTNSNGTSSTYILQDVNNDGRADLVRFYNGTIYAYPASGTEISASQEPAYTYTYSSAYLIPTNVGAGNYHTQMLALNNGTIDKINFKRNDTRERMMSGAINSLGVIIKSEYKQINDKTYPSIYEDGYGATFPYEDFNAYLWATAETQTYYNNVQKACNSYYYTKGKVHRQGRGFLGFETFSVTDNRSRTVKQTFDPLKYGVLMKEETPDSKTENTYSFAYTYVNVFAIRPTQQKVTDLLNNNVITTNYLSYDSYSQPTSIETEYGSGSGLKTKREYVYSNYNSGSGSTTVYVLGLPTEEKITNTRGGASWIDKTIISYNTIFYSPGTKITYTGTAGTSQTSYETFGYDSEGNIISRSFTPYSSAKTLTTSYTYDSKKRWVVTETNPMGLATTYGYDGFGRLTSEIDYLSQTTTFEYDVLDRHIKTISPDGVTSQKAFAWNSSNNGSVISATSTATKRQTSVKYADAFGRTTRESVLGFNGTYSHIDYVYDDYGRLWKKSDPYTSTVRNTVYEYDTYDRVKTVTSASNRKTTITYGNNVVTTDDAGMIISKSYDGKGMLKQSSEAGSTVNFNLLSHEKPVSIVLAGSFGSATTTFEYDAYGRQTKIVDPSAGTIQYDYNPEGLLWKQTNARNQITSYVYEDWGAPKTITTPEQTISYNYHPITKQLMAITGGSGISAVLSYTYDNLGRINTETEVFGQYNLSKLYSYDAGRVATIKYNNVAADVLTYTYNTSGYLSSMKFGTTVIYTVNDRDHMGQLKKYTFGNGVETNRTYSDYGSPKTIVTKKGTTEFVNQSYTFDDTKGLLSDRQDYANGGAKETFLYDSYRRLEYYGPPSLYHKMVYNNLGNILTKPDAGTFAYTISGKPYTISSQTLPALQTVQARYIRDVINGSNINTGNHWAEIQAINSAGTNLALGKSVSGTSSITNANLITDGSTISDPYAYTSGSGAQTITLDLGQTQNLSDIKIWHYYKDWRTYNGSKTEISTNGTNWTALYDASQNGTYKETPLGRKYGPNPDRPAGTNTITYTSSEKPNTIETNGLTATFTYNPTGERILMNLTHANTNLPHSVHYLGGNYERETRNTTVTERLYLGGSAYNAPAIAIRTGGEAWKIYYIHRDYLGSICAVTNTPDGNDPVVAIEKRSYDAWGRLRKPTTLQPYGPGEQPTLFLNRGYTSHEHLPEFGLINCNARLYDPIIGRFLSPDPYVQDPDFSQSFNRYLYCLNNPLSYTDPTGEFFIIDSWVVGFFKGLFTKGESAWKEANKMAGNDAKIWGGLFAADTKQSGWGWQILSRLTWELPQTLAGFIFTQTSNLCGQVDKVEYYGGATVSSGNFWGNSKAITMSSYITGSCNLAADPNNPLFQHEYGHVLQSREMGWAYFSRVGIPSFISDANTHKYQPFEQDANRRAFNYFNEYEPDFYQTEAEYRANRAAGIKRGWNFWENPLDVNHIGRNSRINYYDYHNPEHRALINSLCLRARWYDYFDPFGLIIGTGNGLYYRKHRVR